MSSLNGNTWEVFRFNAVIWVKGGGGGTETSEVKGQCMAGTVHNATVCRVNDEFRKDISS